MQTLLKETQLPASKFPERAEHYICDKCGHDITRHLHRGHAHASTRIGPPRYRCRCGERYVTGAVEWDSMSDREHRKTLMDTFVLGSVAVGPIIGFVFLVRAAILHHSIVLWLLTAAAAIPFAAFAILFTLSGLTTMEVAASLWRTRVARLWTRQ